MTAPSRSPHQFEPGPPVETLPEVGFFGKLPTHGDFLRRGTSDAFVAAWDSWLQECLAASRQALGDRWLDVYLTIPAWRFAAAAGACGPDPVAGVMVPSVDRVGRYFPLTIVARLPPTAHPVSLATDAAPFFESAERLAIETLAAEEVDFESFEAAVLALAPELGALLVSGPVILDPATAGLIGDDRGPWQVPLGSSRDLSPVLQQVLAARLSSRYAPLSVWWTDGSAVVDSSSLILSGLPAPEAFASFLDGDWSGRQWRSVSARIAGARPADVLPLDEMAPLRFRSAGASDVGAVRKVNQDAFLERADVGLWAVADGIGGHSEGEIASRMVCDALADFVPASGFEDVIDAAAHRLGDVNDHLSRAATSLINPVKRGSTVVVLLTRGARCAVLWAGDSRVYRWRDGELTQLTRDHSLGSIDGVPSSAITRAVGAEPTLALDQFRDQVRPGDRFLLCSDGLTRVLSLESIRDWVEQADVRAAVDGLIRSTLEAGAPDNVTAVLVEALG